MTAGYSGKSVLEKLGLKPGSSVALYNPPEHYFSLLGDLPDNITFAQNRGEQTDFIHYFAESEQQFIKDFPNLKKSLAKTGMLWISWPKKSSRLSTDLDENSIRRIGLDQGLVDVKVIAVDNDWSALKFVYRLTDR